MINLLKNIFIRPLVWNILQHMKDHPDKWKFSYGKAYCRELNVRFPTIKSTCDCIDCIEDGFNLGSIHLNRIESFVLILQARWFYSMGYHREHKQNELDLIQGLMSRLKDIKRKSANEVK